MKIFKTIRAARHRLTRVGENEPLNFLSIVVIVALDIFVLWNVFQGLEFQTQQLTQAREAVPSQCQQLAGINYDNDSRWETVESALDAHYNAYPDKRVIPDCVALMDAAEDLNNENTLVSQFQTIESLRQANSRLERENRDYENSYDTLLLEKIADQPDRESITTSRADQVKSDIQTRQAGIEQNNARIESLKTEILGHPTTQAFLEIRNERRPAIEQRYDDLKFWYPLKRLAFQFVFLLPLFLVFLGLYRYSVKRHKLLLTLIFSHLLVIACIPMVIELFRLLLDILPFHFLADLLDLLEDLGLVALWNYLMILFGIGLALGLIYLAQKKLFARDRIRLKRIAKGQCCACGVKLKDYHSHCYACGAENLKTCVNCHKPTFKEGKFCRECGAEEF